MAIINITGTNIFKIRYIIAIIAGHFHANSDIYRKGIYHLSAPGFVEAPHEYKIIKLTYDTKYLFSNPSEISVKTKTYPTMEVKNNNNVNFQSEEK